jgi:hypothetical protein
MQVKRQCKTICVFLQHNCLRWSMERSTADRDVLAIGDHFRILDIGPENLCAHTLGLVSQILNTYPCWS